MSENLFKMDVQNRSPSNSGLTRLNREPTPNQKGLYLNEQPILLPSHAKTTVNLSLPGTRDDDSLSIASDSSFESNRSLRQVTVPSPLHAFSEAKNRINDLLGEMKQHSENGRVFLEQLLQPSHLQLLERAQYDRVEQLANTIDAIMEITKRNQMKVVFSGRTSNGKSTVINALLSQRILPATLGHTTNCFIQVEGTDSESPYLLDSSKPNPRMQPIESVLDLANALKEAHSDKPTDDSEIESAGDSGTGTEAGGALRLQLGKNELLRVFIPRTKCALLMNEVVLLDSPGLDLDDQLDSWIDLHCLDADVFVAVGNSIGSMSQSEMNFFIKVKQRLSKPNIFFLWNRWDLAYNESAQERESVKKQHITRSKRFLIDELRVISDPKLIEKRVFFTSAKHSLEYRARKSTGDGGGGSNTPSTPVIEKPECAFEVHNNFLAFEREVHQTLSSSAIRTKFAAHAERARDMARELKTILEKTALIIEDRRTKCKHVLDETVHRLRDFQMKIERVNASIEHAIQDTIVQIEKKVTNALEKEIQRLAHVVNEFEAPFVPEKMELYRYKAKLNQHVEQQLGQRLQQICSFDIDRQVKKVEQVFLEQYISLVQSEEHKQAMSLAVLPSNFELTFPIDCRRLCADFREDIEFHFSLGPIELWNRLVLKQKPGLSPSPPRPRSPVQLNPSLQSSFGLGGGASTNSGSISQQIAEAALGKRNVDLISLVRSGPSLLSTPVLVGLLFAGLVARAVGWRVFFIGGGLYGGFYVYERLAWSTRARERALKQQYVSYATRQLRCIVYSTGEASAAQVRQELQAAYRRLRREAERVERSLQEDLRRTQEEVQLLESLAQDANVHKNRSSYYERVFDDFLKQYFGNSL